MTIVTKHLDAASADAMDEAASLLRQGQVVAFPTETVYGLAANGLDPDAVQRIFKAKGRPADNPLILHVGSFEEALPLWHADNARLALAARLADAFWPGPLSIVLPRSARVPPAVTAGLDSVAVRVPANSVAQALLARCGFPLAAPSANVSGRPSPTSAAHVATTLDGKIAAILDGGRTRVGIESTVLDLGQTPVRLLRPGHIGVAAIERVVGELATGKAPAQAASPGLRHRHYQPSGMDLRLVDTEQVKASWQHSCAILCLESTGCGLGSRQGPLELLPCDPQAYAEGLYNALYALEGSGARELLIERVPDSDEWRAVSDRLTRAAGVA